MTAVSVDNLSFSYTGTPVLSNVSFEIGEGERIGLIGPNGGGKTTLLQLMMGFLKPSWGSIALFGKSPKKARRQIGWVPQSFSFDRQFPISVLEVVLTGRLCTSRFRYTQEDRAIAREVLEQMGMEGYAKSPFSDLSGGQAQRVLIARALASRPSLLLLDEPTASVDPSTQKEIYALLGRLKGELTLVMVTHDLRAATEQVDRVFLVQRSVTPMSSDAVCEHFAMGLYHPPLGGNDELP